MSRKVAFGMLVSVVLVFTTAYAADVQTGVWKLNIAKSRYKTATSPQSQTVTIAPAGKDGVKLTVNAVNAKGETSTIEYAAQYDGKQYPRTESGANAVPGQMVALKRIDAQTVQRDVFLKGKNVGTERWVISADGKTRTVTQSGTGPDSKPIDNVIVYDKQ